MTRFHFNATPIGELASARRLASHRYVALRSARELGMPVRVCRWMPAPLRNLFSLTARTATPKQETETEALERMAW